MNKVLKSQKFDWCQLIYWNNFLETKNLTYDTIKSEMIKFIEQNPTNDVELIVKMNFEVENIKTLLTKDEHIWLLAFDKLKDAWKYVLNSKIEKI